MWWKSMAREGLLCSRGLVTVCVDRIRFTKMVSCPETQ